MDFYPAVCIEFFFWASIHWVRCAGAAVVDGGVGRVR